MTPIGEIIFIYSEIILPLLENMSVLAFLLSGIPYQITQVHIKTEDCLKNILKGILYSDIHDIYITLTYFCISHISFGVCVCVLLLLFIVTFILI